MIPEGSQMPGNQVLLFLVEKRMTRATRPLKNNNNM
jgi:hypothetical protein